MITPVDTILYALTKLYYKSFRWCVKIFCYLLNMAYVRYLNGVSNVSTYVLLFSIRFVNTINVIGIFLQLQYFNQVMSL
jgi:hypothetical protein